VTKRRKTDGPWRIGTTSYILPDDIIPNVTYLAPLVDDIELVLFESEEISNLPSEETVDELLRIAAEHGITYTIHFPLDVFPGSLDDDLRRKSLDSYQRIKSLMGRLSPFAYIFHLTPEGYGKVPAQDVDSWVRQLDKTLEEMIALGWDPSMLCVETLSYPFDMVFPLVEKYGLSVTLDIGHIWMCDYDAEENARKLLPHARVIHLHGVMDGNDHLGLGKTPVPLRNAFLNSLKAQCLRDSKERVLTLEVFDKMDFKDSMDIVDEFNTHHGGASGTIGDAICAKS
jgi:sugar phosphate isomerase/epimerase